MTYSLRFISLKEKTNKKAVGILICQMYIRAGRMDTMKRIVSIICALCMVLGCFSGFISADEVKIKANQETYQAKVMAICFSDAGTWPNAQGLAQNKVTTGAAVTLGGLSYWDYGLIAVDVTEGNELTAVRTDRDELLDVTTVESAWGNIKAL